MIPLLESHKLLGHGDGSIPPPPRTVTVKQGEDDIDAPNPDFEKWYTYDQFCLTSILISTSTKVNLQLVDIRSTAAV